MATTTLLQFSEVDTETFTPTTTKPSATMKTTVKPVSEKEEVNHYNDWPNTPGVLFPQKQCHMYPCSLSD